MNRWPLLEVLTATQTFGWQLIWGWQAYKRQHTNTGPTSRLKIAGKLQDCLGCLCSEHQDMLFSEFSCCSFQAGTRIWGTSYTRELPAIGDPPLSDPASSQHVHLPGQLSGRVCSRAALPARNTLVSCPWTFLLLWNYKKLVLAPSLLCRRQGNSQALCRGLASPAGTRAKAGEFSSSRGSRAPRLFAKSARDTIGSDRSCLQPYRVAERVSQNGVLGKEGRDVKITVPTKDSWETQLFVFFSCLPAWVWFFAFL